MIEDHPNFQGRGPASQKLVLPGQPEEHFQPAAYTQRVFVHPDQMRPSIPPTSNNPLSKLVALWRTDPAYKVLMIATVTVLIAGIIFATFLVNTLAQSSTSTPKTAIAPVGTANAAPTTPPITQPTFPAPSGGQGSNNGSSQPPKSATVVLPTLVPSDQATPPPDNQNIQLQITDYPQQVRNNSDVQITVMASQPGISVHLYATFDQSIITNTSPSDTTGSDGTVTLNWHVANAPIPYKQSFVARVVAIATAQNGQQISSQTISVQVSNRFKF